MSKAGNDFAGGGGGAKGLGNPGEARGLPGGNSLDRKRDRTISFHQPVARTEDGNEGNQVRSQPGGDGDHRQGKDGGGHNVGGGDDDDAATTVADAIVDDDDDDDDDADARSIATTASSTSTTYPPSDRQYQPRFMPARMARMAHRKQGAAGKRGQPPSSAASAASTNTSYIAPTTPYRRTPILSGALAPFSIMLEVPGLTSKWYVRNDPSGQDVAYRNNPVILDVGLALSLAAAVAANIMLILRFTKILRPRKATALAFVCFTVHDAINIAALVAFGVVRSVDDGFTYSQAYWMTLAATIASLSCTASLLIDYLSTSNFKDSGSGLSPKQTQLIIVVMVLLVYLSFGSLIYSSLLTLSFQDALYFTCTTTLAVGFGDIIPDTVGSRIFLFFYAPLGIVLFAVTIYTARQTILEELEISYRRKRGQFRDKWKTRREQAKKIRRERRSIKKQMEAGETQQQQEQQDTEQTQEKPSSIAEPPTAASSPSYSSSPASATDRVAQEMRAMEAALAEQRQDVELQWTNFRQDLAARERSEFLSKLWGSFSLFLAFWLLGAMAFMFFENWSYFDAFYFCFVLFTTIGFGDFTPKTVGGRTFFIVWSLLGVAVLTIFFSVFSDAWGSIMTGKLQKTSRLLKQRGRKWRAAILRWTQRRGGAQRSSNAAEEDGSGSGPLANATTPTTATRSDAAAGSTPASAFPKDPAHNDTSPSASGGGILLRNGTSTDPPSRKATLMGELRDLNGQPTKPAEALVNLAQSVLSLHHVASTYIATRREAFVSALHSVSEFRHLIPSAHATATTAAAAAAATTAAAANNDHSTSPTATASPWQQLEEQLPTDPAAIEALFASLHRTGGHAAVSSAQEIFAFARMERQVHEVVRSSTTLKGWLTAQQREIFELKQKLRDVQRQCTRGGRGDNGEHEHGGDGDGYPSLSHSHCHSHSHDDDDTSMLRLYESPEAAADGPT